MEVWIYVYVYNWAGYRNTTDWFISNQRWDKSHVNAQVFAMKSHVKAQVNMGRSQAVQYFYSSLMSVNPPQSGDFFLQWSASTSPFCPWHFVWLSTECNADGIICVIWRVCYLLAYFATPWWYFYLSADCHRKSLAVHVVCNHFGRTNYVYITLPEWS